MIACPTSQESAIGLKRFFQDQQTIVTYHYLNPQKKKKKKTPTSPKVQRTIHSTQLQTNNSPTKPDIGFIIKQRKIHS